MNRICMLCLAAVVLQAAEPPRLLPADATKGDVVRDYGAKGDGVSDDTAAIQAALSAGVRVIYLPPGTYRISATLRWGPGEKRQTLEGAGPEHTRVRLADRSPGFNDPANPRALIWTGQAPAQRFRNGLRSLTIETGEGNAGAIGAQFITSNQGGISDVVIRSGTPAGPIGLDLGYTDEQGPILVQRVRVEGFAVGIDLKGSVNSATFEHISLSGQSQAGLRNRGQCISIRGLVSDNRVTAIDNADAWSTATLLDSQLRGGGADVAAVRNAGVLFARRVTTAGYASAIADSSGGSGHGPGTVREYVSQPVQALFPGAPARSLDLPVEETPPAAWPAPGDWISVTAFQPRKLDLPGRKDADGKALKGEIGRPRTITDWSEAFQQAIDSGKPVVYFPNGTYEMHGRVEIRGAVRRIIGFESEFGRYGQLELVTGATTGPVRVERFDWMYNSLVLKHSSTHPLTLATVMKGCDFGAMVKEAGSGDLFFEDVSLHPGGLIELKGGRTFARQLNTEGGNKRQADGPRDHAPDAVENLYNRGGSLWILGFKTENDGTLITTVEGGRTEVVGGLCYANKAYRPEKQWFVSIDSDLSFTLGENVMRNAPFDPVVERRGAEMRIYPKGRMAVRGSGSGIALFSGWRNPAAQAPSGMPGDLAGTAEGTSAMQLRWTPAAGPGIDCQVLELSVGEAPYGLVTVLPPDAGAFRLTRLAPGTTYRVRVSAANGAGSGPAAQVVLATAAGAAPGNGTGLQARWWKDATRRMPLAAPPATPPIGSTVRWSGTLTARYDEIYRIGTGVRDSRIWVDGVQILDVPADARRATAGSVILRAGQPVPIVAEAVVREATAPVLAWSSASQAEEPVPATQLHPVSDDPPGFSITMTAQAREGGALVIEARRSGATDSVVDVPLRTTGDWALLGLQAPARIVIPGGAAAASLHLALANDARPGPMRRIGLAVAPGPGHVVMDAPATCAVEDDDVPAPGSGSGLTAAYFALPDLSGTALGSRLDSRIDFSWNDKAPFKGITLGPDASGPNVGFSARWTGAIEARFSEDHSLAVDIGKYTTAQLWIGETLVVDAASETAPRRGSIRLIAGQRMPLRLEMQHRRSYGAGIGLRWSSPSQWEEIVPTTQLHPRP